MADNVQTPAVPQAPAPAARPSGEAPSLLEALAVHGKQIGFGLLGLGALPLVIPLLQWIFYRTGTWSVLSVPVMVWSVVLAAVTMASAVWYLGSWAWYLGPI